MLNKVMLIGRLGKDPDVKRLENGTAVAKFSVATDESYKDKDGNKVEHTEWHNIVVWRTQAEVAEKYLKKGMLIYVEGKLSNRQYEAEGTKKYFTEIVANTFRFLEKKSESGDDNGYFSKEEPNGPVAAGDEPAPPSDDLPF